MAARGKSCLRFVLLPLAVWFFVALEAPGVSAQQAVIQRVDIVGNRRVPRDTLRSRMFLREGDPFDEDALRRDFQALWNSQYFEDIRLEVEDSPDRPNAKIIVFYVKERPIIRRIEYKGLKSATESDVLERYKERKVGLSVESAFDPTRIKRAEVALKELLSERGRQFAEIRPTFERIPATNAIKLIFNIEEGPKVKVGKIEVEGNEAFSDGKIVRAMRHSRPYGIPLGITFIPMFNKTFDRRKLSEDLEIGVRSLYQDNGFFKVLVQDPVVETLDVKRGGLPLPLPFIGRKRGKVTNIKIPIEEGERYRMGKLFVRSSDPDKGLFFKSEFLQAAFPLKEGDLFSVERVRKALQDYTKIYGEFGFIDFTAQPNTEVDGANKTITLTLDFDEQKQFYVRRIEFAGNTTTRDKVIRREVLLDEGDLFNNRYWELSLLRLNQLDFFEPIKPEHADLKRNLKDGSVDLLLKVKEKGKQSIGLTGGVSGLAGSFIGISYQTNNFLGLGETLTFSAEFGDRQRNFVFGFTEPYLFDRPIASGFTIFSTRFSFDQSRETSLLVGQRVQLDRNSTQNYDQNSTGFTLFASYPLRRIFSGRVGVTYSYSISTINAFSDASRLLFENLQFRGFAGPSALRGIRSSRLTPTFSYNTTDSGLNPTRGKSFYVAMGFEGGPLQGTVNTFTQIVEAKFFKSVNKRRNVVGLRLLTAFATGYSGVVLPPFNRFYIGGEDNVRGFDIRTITPIAFIPVQQTQQVFYLHPTILDGNGNPTLQVANVPVLINTPTFPGGDLQSVTNVEYRIPLVGPVGMSLFFDAGLNGVLRRSQLQLDPTGVDLLRQQFPTTTFKNRLELASGTNFKLRTSTGVEFVVQLPVLNAPFRVYYAYNLNRVRTTLRPPQGDFAIDPRLAATLPQGVLENQVIPQLNATLGLGARALNYFEPKSTFRFTVSRTF
jgi:outer membrane protein insertion porin family